MRELYQGHLNVPGVLYDPYHICIADHEGPKDAYLEISTSFLLDRAVLGDRPGSHLADCFSSTFLPMTLPGVRTGLGDVVMLLFVYST